MLPFNTHLTLLGYNSDMIKKKPKRHNAGFSKRFNGALRINNLSEKPLGELALIFDVARATVQKWRKKDVFPSNYMTEIICKELDVSFEWLLTGKGTPKHASMYNSSERILIDMFRNLSADGQQKLISYAFYDCIEYEVDTRSKTDDQSVLKLINKDNK